MIQIKDKSACCGCAACVQICPKQCISLKEDKEGFLYPTVNRNLCIECGKCETVCPKLHSFEAHEPLKVFAAQHVCPAWATTIGCKSRTSLDSRNR